jgi:hypothetical protein
MNVVTKEITPILLNFPDGHPLKFNDNYFISDTYPAKNRLRKIIKVSSGNGIVEQIASVFHPVPFRGESRCDPHPSLSADLRYLQIDSVHDYKRTVVIFDLESFK